MAYFVGNIYSENMKQDTQLHVILPQDGRRYIWQEKPKTLVLLHGLSDNAATWVRRTAIERYAERYNLAVLMPEVQRSWYFDMVNGISAFSYITEELPRIAEALFCLSVERENMLIAGLSMGGYGALRCALEAPGIYGYCGAFSGAYDLNDIVRISKEKDAPVLLKDIENEIAPITGGKDRVPKEASIPEILQRCIVNGSDLPKVYMVCGTEDFLYHQTTNLRSVCEKKIKDFYYEEWPGIHEWNVWDKAIERMLKLYLGEGRTDN